MDELKVCIDLSNEFDNRLFGLFNAYKEREENILIEGLKIDTLIEQLLIDAKEQNDYDKLNLANGDTKKKLFELALQKDKFWANGKKLNVKFLGGTEYLHNKVIKYAKQWEKYAHIEFNFIESGNAEIRIAFNPGGSWSYVGTEALNIVDQSLPTMNFGWFDESTSESEFSRTTIHEFGHSLGCIHEHQSPDANIDWNKPVVYDYYARNQRPPWDKAKVDANVFAKFTIGQITNSKFDDKSIMLYPIPKEFTNNGFSVGMNNVISSKDAEFIAICYPKPKA